jgi:hypothetical protein
MSGFWVDNATITSPAFLALSDGAARLWLRAGCYGAAYATLDITPPVLRALLGTGKEANEIVGAGFWRESDFGYRLPEPVQVSTSLDANIESPRARAGRIGGRRSAEARAEAFGSSQPRSSPKQNELASGGNAEATREATREAKPSQPTKQDPKQNELASAFPPEAKTGVVSPSHTLPLPLRSVSSALSVISEDSSSLQLSSEGPDPLPARGAKKPKQKAQRWRRVPSDWEPNAAHLQLAVELNVDFKLELAKLRDHEFAQPKSDADATFRNWLRGAKPSLRPLGPQSYGCASAETETKYSTMEDIDRALGIIK